MTNEKSEICKIDLSNQFWLNYLSLERQLIDMSDYIAIHEANKKTYSFKIMQLYFAVCSEIDSIFKHIRENLKMPPKINRNGKILDLNFDDHKKMLRKYLEDIDSTKVNLNLTGFIFDLQPFKGLKNSEISFEWWSSYNNVKHNRVKYFNQATLENLLLSMSALHILNLILGISTSEEFIENYDSIVVQAPVTHYQFPVFQLKNSGSNRYPGIQGSHYICRLDNGNIRQ